MEKKFKIKPKSKRGLWLKFDRLLSDNFLKQLGILASLLLIALVVSYLLLGFSGSDWQNFCKDKDLSMWLLPLYLLIDSNALNTLYAGGHVHGWMLFASSITFLFGAFVFNGIIIGIITNSIEQRVENHRKGHIHYLKSGHYIVMGYDDMVPSMISYIFKKAPDAYVLLMGAMDAETIKEKLRKRFDKDKLDRIIINYGHRTSTDYFKDIHLEAAEEVFVVGNHKKPEHDALNVECADSIYRYLKDKAEAPSRITCVFKDLDTYAAFKTSEIFDKFNGLNIEFTPYNFFAGWAKQVFVKRCYRDFDSGDEKYSYPLVYAKKDKAGHTIAINKDDKRYVHLVFVGTTNFAVSFAMEAAHVLHFPNAAKAKTLITFIDINADKERDEFITRNRHYFEVQPYYYCDLTGDGCYPSEKEERRITDRLAFKGEAEKDYGFLDVEFEFIKGNVFSKQVQDVISRWAQDAEGQYLSVFLALADQRENFVMGMNMPDAVYDEAIPLFIRQDRSDNFVTSLRKVDRKDEYTYSVVTDGRLDSIQRHSRYANIYPFGMNETAFSADDRSLKRAKLINYLYETANYDTYKFQGTLVLDAIPEDMIWEKADSYWQKLSVALKWSSLYNSYTMRTKQMTLRALRGLDIDDESHDYDTLSDDEVEQMAQVEHNRWNVEKLLMGFRKPHKDEDKYEHSEFADKLKKNKDLFIHHDIRPFDQLSAIKELDYEFSRYIPWIMKMTEKDE